MNIETTDISFDLSLVEDDMLADSWNVLKDTLKDVVPSTSFEVTDSLQELLLNLWCIRFGSIEARFDFSQVVGFSHTVDKSSEDFVDVATWNVRLEVAITDHSWCLVHWAQSKSNSVCNIGTGLEVVSSRPISLLCSNVRLDRLSMNESMFRNFLNKGLNILELSSPCLD